MFFKIKNKFGKGSLIPTVIFILLNLIFFGLMLGFVLKSGTGAVIYEQAYAKEIALIIDNAKPYTEAVIDFSKGFEIAEENKRKEQLVFVNNIRNEIVIKLTNKGGYGVRFFSDYNVEISEEGNKIIVKISVGGENE